MSTPLPTQDPPDIPEVLPILPLNNVVLFPGMFLPLVVSGDTWVKLVDEAALATKMVGVFMRTQPGEGFDPLALARTGAVALIVRMLRLPHGAVQILVQGQARIQIRQLIVTEPYPQARVAIHRDPAVLSVEVSGLARAALAAFQQIIQLSPTLPDELAIVAANTAQPGMLADLIAANLNLKPEDQQLVLDTLDVQERLRQVLSFLEREREILTIGRKAQEEMSKSQREYVLRQQLEAIKRELGETDDHAAEIAELRRRLEAANLPEEARKEAEREISRLERMPPGAAEYVVARTYLDWLLDLPWNVSTEDNLDLTQARQVLDEDHYDLERIKERIIEYLAVRKLRLEQDASGSARGPILCFVGPPGVGKTSLGTSIARALGRKFVRVALGGVRDEAEIRGHRRTYIGALPGRIIQGINRAGSNNPVFMLDEVDKLSVGFQGDPAAALLEVLDPEQNVAFVDRYLDVPFDLSRALFICTANRSDTIPPALLDRMELLELAGYTEMEKLEICRRYLIQRQRNEQGLAERAPTITEAALRRLIREYTHEAGVRDLERRIGAIYRKMATRAAEGQPLPDQVDAPDLDDLLGPPRFRSETLLGEDEVGVVTGLAWTPTGGDVLFVEASVVPGNGQLTLTGQLGDVMKESARAALTYARSRARALNIPTDFAQICDIHIHVPAGAVPKDGPSAGITMASALISALTDRRAYKHVAMTGEITLRGKVLPIGGVKEKVLAAQRAGVRTVLLPKANAPDLRELPEETRQQIDIVLVEHMDEVLPRVLHPKSESVTLAEPAPPDGAGTVQAT
ncbi:endopeptidase La [Roseiflexus castenholzii]|jgi:ATP-dependent Lon protease|uniref:Lon protease n=1 Tax=Roseiflexus castenholzii (strain DSM 13941 / HLO8) TaxID=383372 RepID=LON_ROSCS|nr:endopeptidase La [Roseiflexus castenholzii]A7NM80.1 RecName: Full=Lon protease; AltName: Full=ATP-dependent protease La [Roseiflexus castenholzii DSM 13941]ABU58635.1 ATP-dependent protease La [Roseiflexus castenholzii DSM 13941]